MSSFIYKRPFIPCLHKCHYCKKRLSKEMPVIIAEAFFTGDGCIYDYYCSTECAKQEIKKEKFDNEIVEKLNREIMEEI